jgi:hypothetical protein
MGNKRHKPEEIVTKLRQIEVLCCQGMPRIDSIRQVQITDRHSIAGVNNTAVSIPPCAGLTAQSKSSEMPHSGNRTYKVN